MYQNLLIAVDLTPQSEALLQRACKLARHLGASVHVIYVEPGVGAHSLEEIEIGLEGLHEHTLDVRRAQLEKLCQGLSPSPQNIILSQGDIATRIIEYKEASQADLVIMGEHHSFWHLQHTNRQVLKHLNGDLLTLSLDGK